MTNIYSGEPELVDPYADVPPPDEEPAQAAPSRLSTIRLSDVQPERVSWLGPGRIPAGKLVTLDGDPSLGKSTLSLAFAAIVTTGGTWPDNTPCAFPGDVILLSAEDGLADTVRPRLDAARADVTRVHAVQGVTLPDGTLRPPTLTDVDELHRLVTETGARLLVVDVLMAYLPSGTDSHKDQDIRRVLSRLSSLADTTGCTVLLLRHLNKAKGGDPMYRLHRLHRLHRHRRCRPRRDARRQGPRRRRSAGARLHKEQPRPRAGSLDIPAHRRRRARGGSC